jgi:cobalt-zinc-cadmium efflux system protein
METEHHHDHQPTDVGRAFAIGIGLNLAFLVSEAVFGVLAHSTALLADAAHNASDVLGLVMAWAAIALGRRKPSSRHTYGLRRATVLAALANAMLLLVAVGGVGWEAVGRLAHPDDVHGV